MKLRPTAEDIDNDKSSVIACVWLVVAAARLAVLSLCVVTLASVTLWISWKILRLFF